VQRQLEQRVQVLLKRLVVLQWLVQQERQFYQQPVKLLCLVLQEQWQLLGLQFFFVQQVVRF
jgi:hypothetical protein